MKAAMRAKRGRAKGLRPSPLPHRSLTKRALFRAFLALERVGIHVLPRHFYSPVADRRWLAANPNLWKRRLKVVGIDWSEEAQLRWLAEICAPYLEEVRGFPFLQRARKLGLSFRYGFVEAQVLHCVVRSLAPRLLVEIGSGASTLVSSDAAARNRAEGRGETRIVTIDPYAPRQLAALEAVELHDLPLQLISSEVFAGLGEGDLLFLDSTHVLKTGSELHRLYLEVLPALAAGVTVQVHDVYLPRLYSPWVMEDFWDWQETALLAALLTQNDRFEVLCCQSALHDSTPERLQEVLPDYLPLALEEGLDAGGGGHYPSSIWLRTL
jgi:hypothetical protein